MSLLTQNSNSFSSKDFKANAQMIEANELSVELSEEVVKR